MHLAEIKAKIGTRAKMRFGFYGSMSSTCAGFLAFAISMRYGCSVLALSMAVITHASICPPSICLWFYIWFFLSWGCHSAWSSYRHTELVQMKRNNVNKIRAYWFHIAEMDQYITATVLTEDPSQSPDTTLAAHNQLSLQVQEMWCALLTSIGIEVIYKILH